jgi:hypothetical protein
MVSRHIYPMLEGARVSGEHDKMLADLYEEWQAGCRAAAAGLQRTLYPNEYAPMPKMPNDDEEHQPCRQMAAVLIERTVYGEQVAQRWFHPAAENIKNHPNCANHSKICACHEGLKGWTYGSNQLEAQLLEAFYKAHYEEEKDEAYLEAVRSAAKFRGRSFEQQMEMERAMKAAISEVREEEKDEAYLAVARAVANMRGTTLEYELQRQRKQKADLERAEALEAAKKKAKAERRKGWVFICYQDVGEDALKHTNDEAMHGYYKVTKTADCYEFMLMETDMQHPSWHQAIAEKKVQRIPLDMAMGVKGSAFENVTPDKIYQS